VDPLYDALKAYQQNLVARIDNITTERLTPEMLNVIANHAIIDEVRDVTAGPDELQRITQYTEESKQLQVHKD
jgi:hypothetical protein